MGKIDDILNNQIPTPTYMRDKDKLLKYLEHSYKGMLVYLVNELAKGTEQAHLVREMEIMRQVNFWVAQLDKDMAKSLDSLMRKTFKEGQAYHLLSVQEAKTWEQALSATSFNKIQRGKVEALLADTYNDILMATHNTATAIKLVVRDTVQKVAQYHSLLNNNYKEQARELYKQLTKKGLSETVQKEGFVGIVDKAGRRWDLKTYSNMVITTKVNQGFIEGVIHESSETGFDLAIISEHGAKDDCRKWEGVIISMTGATEGYPTYKQARATNQIWHPNCEHTIHPIRNVNMLHPDDLEMAKKKARALNLDSPTKTRPPKITQPTNAPNPLKAESYQLPINKDSEIYNKIGEKHYNGLHDIMNVAPILHRQVWGKMEKDLTVMDAKANVHPCCYGTKGIKMNVEKDSKGSSYSNPYQTTFHEFGHNIDYIANVKYGTGISFHPISYTFKDGLLANTIKEEVMSFVNSYEKKLKEEFKNNKTNGEWLYQNGFITPMAYNQYQRTGELPSNIKYKKYMAYAAFEKELKEIPLKNRTSLSDIVEGATRAKVQAGAGHGASYWKDETSLPTEAFAHFMEVVANKEEMEVLKKYLPQSWAVFEQILTAINEG